MTQHKKKGAGGSRPGAGRKTTAKKEITMRVTAKEKKMIEASRKKPTPPAQ